MKFLAVFLLCLVCVCLVPAKKRGWGYICGLEPEVGPCRALIQSYFFNKTSARCELFHYGGCGGNGNNFETEKKCMKRCKHVTART